MTPDRSRVMIVEDNLVAVAVLTKKVCDAGVDEFEIDTVASGEKGVELVSRLFFGHAFRRFSFWLKRAGQNEVWPVSTHFHGRVPSWAFGRL